MLRLGGGRKREKQILRSFKYRLVLILLFFQLPNIKCVGSEGSLNVPSTHNVKCSIGKTDPRGRLSVACVPSGEYYLAASHVNGPKSINFSPNPQKVVVSQAASEVRNAKFIY